MGNAHNRLHELMVRGPSWSVACYAASDGCDYVQYQGRCFDAGMMAIDNNAYVECQKAVEYFYTETGRRL